MNARWDFMRSFNQIRSKSGDSSCCSRLAEMLLRTKAQTPHLSLKFWCSSNPGQARWLVAWEGEISVSVRKRMSCLLNWRKWYTESRCVANPRMLQNLILDRRSWEDQFNVPRIPASFFAFLQTFLVLRERLVLRTSLSSHHCEPVGL